MKSSIEINVMTVFENSVAAFTVPFRTYTVKLIPSQMRCIFIEIDVLDITDFKTHLHEMKQYKQ